MLRHVKVVIQLLLKGGALIIGFSNLEVTDEFDEYSFMKMIVKKAWLKRLQTFKTVWWRPRNGKPDFLKEPFCCKPSRSWIIWTVLKNCRICRIEEKYSSICTTTKTQNKTKQKPKSWNPSRHNCSISNNKRKQGMLKANKCWYNHCYWRLSLGPTFNHVLQPNFRPSQHFKCFKEIEVVQVEHAPDSVQKQMPIFFEEKNSQFRPTLHPQNKIKEQWAYSKYN